MSTPEGKVKNKIKYWLSKNMPGHWQVWPRGGPFGKAGCPDLLLCWHGVFIAIEVKADNGEASALQMMNLKLIQQAGGIAALVRGFDVAKLERIKQLCLSRSQATHGQPCTGESPSSTKPQPVSSS